MGDARVKITLQLLSGKLLWMARDVAHDASIAKGNLTESERKILVELQERLMKLHVDMVLLTAGQAPEALK